MIRRCMRSISYPIVNRQKWNEEPYVSISELSYGHNLVTIRLPKGNYRGVGGRTNTQLTNTEIDATFFVWKTIEGTPLQAVAKLQARELEPGALYRYVEGNNQWLFSREVFILNGALAFIMLPTVPKTALVSTRLMECSSRVSKVLKEKVIPDIIDSLGENITMKIANTEYFVVKNVGTIPYKIVSEDDIRDVLIEHIDDIIT